MPELAVETLDGDRVKLADYRGKVLLVNFWAENVHPDIQPSAVLLICKLYNASVTDYQVEAICKHQALDRTGL